MNLNNKIIIIILVITGITMLSATGYYNTEEQKLKRFCNQAREYPNVHNLNDEEHLAFSLSNLVRYTLFFVETDYIPTNPVEILKSGQGDCDDHAVLYHSCCDILDLDCDIKLYIYKNGDHHKWVTVNIDNNSMFVDPTMSEGLDYRLFKYGEVNPHWFTLIEFEQNPTEVISALYARLE